MNNVIEYPMAGQTPEHGFCSKSLESGEPLIPDQVTGNLVELFKLLADPTRLKILLSLLELGESNVRDLCERVGQSQPAVSHHLALMRSAGLIDRRRDGKHNFYYLVPREPEQLLSLLLVGVPTDEPLLRLRKMLANYSPSGLSNVPKNFSTSPYLKSPDSP